MLKHNSLCSHKKVNYPKSIVITLNLYVYCMCLHVQVVILERRNAAGKALFKPVTPWNGSEEEKQHLLEELERLQKDPSILIHDAMLPELNNEFASVCSISATEWLERLNEQIIISIITKCNRLTL